MGEFLSAQLDFIYFFYGLAFILLGSVCFAIVRTGHERTTWSMLGLFGIIHGIGEWLDLFALVVSDNPHFAAFRLLVMMASFVCLAEFARRSAEQRGWPVPGPWIYLPGLALVALAGFYIDRAAADCVTRYLFGFTGAAGAALIFARDAWRLSGPERRFNVIAAAGFGLYAIAAGLIVPKASIWPASVINHHAFFMATGLPIQLVRGLLAAGIALAAWSIWEQKQAQDVASPLYTRYLKSQYLLTLAAMGIILLTGWVLTEHLGSIYKRNVEAQSRGDVDLLAGRLAAETNSVVRMAEALAGSPSLERLFADTGREDGKRVLDLAVEASGADIGFVMDVTGRVLAASGRSATSVNMDFVSSNPFKSALRGKPAREFAFNATTRGADYITSFPIGSSTAPVAGVVVFKKSLADFEKDLRRYESAFFLVDPDGIVIMTNRPETQQRAMWPISSEAKGELAPVFGAGVADPVLKRDVLTAEWTTFEGVRDYVHRRFMPNSQWSIVLVKPTQEIFASRVLGIAITLFGTVMTLIYLLGRERRVHDRVELDKRLELQELATSLQYRATTDPLTGLSNRLRFNESLSMEMLRSQRYGTPLSLVLYDIDHFKRVNDLHGHLVGDSVLIELSRFVAGRIRATDVLSRWGGEEFAVLLPNTSSEMAMQFAEQLCAAVETLPFAEVGNVTCSLGVAEYDSETAEAFVTRADIALYRAKLSGRNRVALAPDRDEIGSGAESAA